MEREGFFSGYCRQCDSSRTVCAEAEGSALCSIDCLFETCPYSSSCPIAEQVCHFLSETA